MSSITVNDKNHPLGKHYLSVYPVTAVSSHTVSNHQLGLWSGCHKNSKQSESDPGDLSGSMEQVMYRASNLHCILHRTNTSQWGQDVVATLSITTVIYTP